MSRLQVLAGIASAALVVVAGFGVGLGVVRAWRGGSAEPAKEAAPAGVSSPAPKAARRKLLLSPGGTGHAAFGAGAGTSPSGG